MQKRGQRNNRRKSRGGSERLSLVSAGKFTTPKVGVHRYSRTTNALIVMTEAGGWGAGGFDLEMVFTLSNTLFLRGGVAYSTVANPGASEFIALYDEYRIVGAEVAIMWSSNDVLPGASTAPHLPILNIAFDPSDSSVISLASILQYQNLQTVQMGNQRTQDGYVVKFKPVPNLTAGGSQGAVVPSSSPFLQTDTPFVEHYGLKIFYDNCGGTSTATSGTMSFYIKYHYEMKLSH